MTEWARPLSMGHSTGRVVSGDGQHNAGHDDAGKRIDGDGAEPITDHLAHTRNTHGFRAFLRMPAFPGHDDQESLPVYGTIPTSNNSNIWRWLPEGEEESYQPAG